jgi:hypothetical protein
MHQVQRFRHETCFIRIRLGCVDTKLLLKGSAIMKMMKLAILVAVIAVTLFLTLPDLSWAAR